MQSTCVHLHQVIVQNISIRNVPVYLTVMGTRLCKLNWRINFWLKTAYMMSYRCYFDARNNTLEILTETMRCRKDIELYNNILCTSGTPQYPINHIPRITLSVGFIKCQSHLIPPPHSSVITCYLMSLNLVHWVTPLCFVVDYTEPTPFNVYPSDTPHWSVIVTSPNSVVLLTS